MVLFSLIEKLMLVTCLTIRYNKFRKLKVDKKRHGLQISGRIKS